MTNQLEDKQLSESFFKKLIEILSAENETLSLIQDSLEQQYSVLLKSKISDFLKILEEQQTLIWDTKQHEMLRQQELKKYLPEIDDIRLKEIIPCAPESYQQDLNKLQSEFDQYTDNIETMQKRNQVLIKKSLEFVQEQIQFLQNLNQSNYSASGKPENGKMSMLDKQV